MPLGFLERSLAIDPDRREAPDPPGPAAAPPGPSAGGAVRGRARLRARTQRPGGPRPAQLDPGGPGPEGTSRPDAGSAPPGRGAKSTDRAAAQGDPGESRRPGAAVPARPGGRRGGPDEPGRPELSGGPGPRSRLSAGSPGPQRPRSLRAPARLRRPGGHSPGRADERLGRNRFQRTNLRERMRFTPVTATSRIYPLSAICYLVLTLSHHPTST